MYILVARFPYPGLDCGFKFHHVRRRIDLHDTQANWRLLQEMVFSPTRYAMCLAVIRTVCMHRELSRCLQDTITA
jgi:hypothetical protein